MRGTIEPGRVNYQPNSWGEGPRESPERGFPHFPAAEDGEKRRIRPERFADHYSQARLFWISQTPIEQAHVAAALTFELSKCERLDIRERVVSHLVNVHDDLAGRVAEGLRLKTMPDAAPAAVKTRTDLPPSPALSMLKNPPASFAGRKIGALVTDGTDARMLKALERAVEKEGAKLEIVAPRIGGVESSDGSWIEAKQRIDGGPSTLYDAVALLPSKEGADLLAGDAATRDFVADAFAHAKFIGAVATAAPLLEKAGVEEDDGVVRLNAPRDADAFVQACRKFRFWPREEKVKRT